MTELSAAAACALARDVYQLVEAPRVEVALARIKSLYDTFIEFGQDSVVPVKTGGPGIIKSRTAFGLCGLGKGIYQGHAFIVLRGTKYLADWLTNLNVGVSRSSYGQSVHDGFHQAFKSTRQKIKPFIASLSSHGVHSVHCIGHSVGGGMATMCAEYVKASTTHSPYLYTFGAPRVGLQSFADMLSSNIGPERIYRVYHQTDIVPCVPFWPFVHAPTYLCDSYDYFQPSPGVFPNAKWHDISLYVQTVGTQKWTALRKKRNVCKDSSSVLNWLNKEGPVNFNAANLEWLDKAINYVLYRCLGGVGNTVTSAFSSTFTLMDQLAYILKKGIDLSKDISGLVLSLIRKIMKILGMNSTIEKADATFAFIRSVFQKLAHRVSVYCQQVLDNVLVGGRNY